jgi:hypothetical protein
MKRMKSKIGACVAEIEKTHRESCPRLRFQQTARHVLLTRTAATSMIKPFQNFQTEIGPSDALSHPPVEESEKWLISVDLAWPSTSCQCMQVALVKEDRVSQGPRNHDCSLEDHTSFPAVFGSPWQVCLTIIGTYMTHVSMPTQANTGQSVYIPRFSFISQPFPSELKRHLPDFFQNQAPISRC